MAPKTFSKSFPTNPSEALPPSNKPYVREIFQKIARNYDRFNAIASFGMHRHWRKQLLRRVPPDAHLLDVATGTGDVALLAAVAGCHVTAIDLSAAMLARAQEKDIQQRVRWIEGSADALPFLADAFDCITSAFALRNERAILDEAFRENVRVLRPSGIALHMDFGRPENPFLRAGHALHLRRGVPMIGRVVCGASWPEGYLKSTIEQFYEPAEVMEKMLDAGFADAWHVPLMGGVVQIYSARKP